MPRLIAAVQRFLFRVALTVASRGFLLRDVLYGRLAVLASSDGNEVTRCAIVSGRNRVDALLVRPAGRETRAAVLICHGIGETVGRWLGVQRLLAECGVASLVFDYSGYGRSTGAISAEQCETDALAACAFLKNEVPGVPLSLLGFSLGSGIATAVLSRTGADRLVLCSSFTSFRKAAFQVGLPRVLEFLAPPVWATEETLPGCGVPVLIVHGDWDQLFPVAMAVTLQAAAGAGARLVVMPGLRHDDPYYRPTMEYWGMVGRFLLGE